MRYGGSVLASARAEPPSAGSATLTRPNRRSRTTSALPTSDAGTTTTSGSARSRNT